MDYNTSLDQLQSGSLQNIRGQEINPNLYYCAFGKRARAEMMHRAGYVSEVEGDDSSRPLHAAHWSHNRASIDYDVSANGAIMSDLAHLAMHMSFKGYADVIGLSENANNGSIEKLIMGIRKWNRDNGIDWPDWEIVQRATNLTPKVQRLLSIRFVRYVEA